MSDQMDTGSESTGNRKHIRAAMETFSIDLISGCRMFADLSKKAKSINEIKYFNTACILFATSSIEAKINECVSIAQAVHKEEPKSFYHSLAPLMRKLRLSEKWNLIASNENGTLWDKEKEPFQSHELISSLRNELVHYKGHLLPKAEVPNRKIKSLMDKFGITNKSIFMEDEASGWVNDLLNCRELGNWVALRTVEFDNSILALLNGSA